MRSSTCPRDAEVIWYGAKKQATPKRWRSKEAKAIVAAVQRAGGQVERTASGHLKVIGPAGSAIVASAPNTGRAGGREDPPLVPAIMAAFATAYTFACLGIPTAQMWWFTALALVVLVFVSIERGQFRTTRPKARLKLAANER